MNLRIQFQSDGSEKETNLIEIRVHLHVLLLFEERRGKIQLVYCCFYFNGSIETRPQHSQHTLAKEKRLKTQKKNVERNEATITVRKQEMKEEK